MTKFVTRRKLIQATVCWGAVAILQGPVLDAAESSPVLTPLDVDSRLELAVDPRWIASLDGLRLVQHRPVPREIVLSSPSGVVDPRRRSWESMFGYVSVLKDGDLYRMYYRDARPSSDPDGHEFFCYAESRDGIHWTKPDLQLFSIPGSDAGNAITEENKKKEN